MVASSARARPFRFGLSTWSAASRQEWQDRARRAEGHGFSTLLLPDHVVRPLAALPALVSAADATERLRVGTFVLDNDVRHPLLLAKEAATIDLLSDGRLELGLGAGWEGEDHRLLGLDLDPPHERVARLERTIDVLRAELSGDGGGTFEHRRVQGRVPILVGAGGPRMLRLAAERADAVGLAPVSRADGSGLEVADLTAEAMDAKVARVEATGHDPERNVLLQVVEVTSDRHAVATGWSAKAPPLTPEQVLASPHVLTGTQKQMVEQLRQARERWGISYWTAFEHHLDALAPVVEALAGR